MYVAGSRTSICDKSMCAPGDHHNFVIVYEKQVTSNKRRIHWRERERERANNVSPWECKKKSAITPICYRRV